MQHHVTVITTLDKVGNVAVAYHCGWLGVGTVKDLVDSDGATQQSVWNEYQEHTRLERDA